MASYNFDSENIKKTYSCVPSDHNDRIVSVVKNIVSLSAKKKEEKRESRVLP